MPAPNQPNPTHPAVARTFNQPARGPIEYPEYLTPKRPHASINESVFEVAAPFDVDPLVLQSRQALKAAREAAERCHGIAEAVLNDVTRTEAGRHHHAADAIHRASNPAVAKVQAAIEKLHDKITTMTATLAGPPVPTSPVGHFQHMETRNMLASMKPADRARVIKEAIADGDHVTLGAVLRAPAWLTGMDKGEVEDIRRRWQHATHPSEMAQLATLKQVLEHVERGANLLMTYSFSLTSPVLVQKAKQAEQRVTAAVA